ncbi:ATP-dependent DNA helicase [Panus rudis PR-1116 ss-1]|nr:ATP-dependent DNA helicase [Panus rudis PR-1116 ss-1]
MEQAYDVLRNTFGFESFRLSQEAVIRRLLVDNENALVLFPTGGGKSLTYQVPALCLEGLTLVISPLIALMKDQVDALVRRGVKAASMDSTQSADRMQWIKNEVLSGSMKILYVAPERLNNESFVQLMRRVRISVLAVDESHCISQWGSSFRPEYLKIARFAEEMDVERVLCLTATATKTVADDICKNFLIHPIEGVFRTPIYRPNLAFHVEVVNDYEEKIHKLVPMLQTRTGPAIVYVALQKQAEELASRLRAYGLDPMFYHAGMPSEERERIQLQFMESEKGIVCATIAFGMGIDKGECIHVIHFTMPKSLENYSQEVGRAGRDGLPSQCTMFLCNSDIPILEGFARGDTCAKKDVELWLQEVAMKEPAPDGTIDFNLNQQSRLYDIRANVLNLCYAQLELDYNYIRAVTPFYSVYDITPRGQDGLKKIQSDASATAQVIKQYWVGKGANYTIDVVQAAQYSKTDRSELARKLTDWELDGHVFTKPSQVRNRYAVLNEMPKEAEGIRVLADLIYQRMLQREQETIQKIRQVIDFAVNDDCLPQALAEYFGDPDGVPGGMCGQCTFCQTGAGVEFNPTAEGTPDPAKLRAILDACPERDDPRLLARMAFGITSPRLTYGKWSTSHPLFGSMVSCDFNALVEAFDKECKKVGYQKVEAAQPTISKKRTYTQSSASTSSYSRGRGRNSSYPSRGGGGYKRRKYY